MPKPRFQMWMSAVVLALAAIALYWPATGYDFVNYDDPVYFSENPHVLEGLTWRNLAWAFQTTLCASWYPVSWLSFMLDAEIFGRGPAGPHLTNVLLHAANGVLLFLLWKRLAGSLWRSALVAGLFVLHPLHVESVAWVSERKDVLSTFFGFLTLLAYARYAQGRGRRKSETRNPKSEGNPKPETRSPKPEGAAWDAVPVPAFDVGCSMFGVQVFYLLSLTFFALSLLSKPMLVTWPFVMLLLDYWPMKRMQNAECRMQKPEAPDTPHVSRFTFHVSRPTLHAPRSTLHVPLPLFLEKLPFLLLAIIASAVTIAVHKQEGVITSLAGIPMSGRIANAFVSYARYLGQMFWPVDLAIPYLHPGHWPPGLVGLGAALVAGLSAVSLWQGRRRPYLLVGWFWFLGTLVPVIGLIQWGNQAMADRFLYVPSVGLFVALAWGLGEVLDRWRLPKPAVASAAALVLLALALRSRDQLRYWRDGEALFRHSLEVTENNYFAHNNLGAALVDKGQAEEAIRQFQEAIRLRPDEANAHHNLGNALLKQGQTDAAISQFQLAARLKPESATIHYNLGIALGNQGQTDAAISQLQEAIRLKPAYPEALGTLAGAFDGQGKYAEAIRLYQAALKSKPNQEEVLNNLAWLLATCPDAAFRNGREAVRLATRACELTSDAKPLLIGTLAAAQAEAGDFQAAIAAAERAAVVAASLHLEKVAMRNRELLQLYRQGQPFHEKKGQ